MQLFFANQIFFNKSFKRRRTEAEIKKVVWILLPLFSQKQSDWLRETQKMELVLGIKRQIALHFSWVEVNTRGERYSITFFRLNIMNDRMNEWTSPFIWSIFNRSGCIFLHFLHWICQVPFKNLIVRNYSLFFSVHYVSSLTNNNWKLIPLCCVVLFFLVAFFCCCVLAVLRICWFFFSTLPRWHWVCFVNIQAFFSWTLTLSKGEKGSLEKEKEETYFYWELIRNGMTQSKRGIIFYLGLMSNQRDQWCRTSNETYFSFWNMWHFVVKKSVS